MIRQNGATGGLTPDTSKAKATLRDELAAHTRRLDGGRRAQYSRTICERIAGLEELAAAAQVILYSALADEVSLDALIAHPAIHGKTLFLPRTCEPPGFVSWELGQPLSRRAHGVLEPKAGEGPRSVPTLVLVPGRGYDRSGRRLGRGGGWYDRALSRLPADARTVGVAFACQIVAEVPCEPHDRRVDHVVTEEFAVDCRTS